MTRIVLSGAAILSLLLTGCASQEPGEHHTVAFPTPSGPPPPDYVATEFPIADDYMYYPAYQVYYSNYRREYVFLEHGAWVSRSAPPRTVRKKLSASPSVRLGFSDSPSLHHVEVTEQYPKDWTPTGEARGDRDDKKENDGRGYK